MQNTHTPGPWAVESEDGVDFTVLGGKGQQARVAVECSERDARLIAAAPDLLAVLWAIHANAAESPEWIRARIEPVITRATGA